MKQVNILKQKMYVYFAFNVAANKLVNCP